MIQNDYALSLLAHENIIAWLLPPNAPQGVDVDAAFLRALACYDRNGSYAVFPLDDSAMYDVALEQALVKLARHSLVGRVDGIGIRVTCDGAEVFRPMRVAIKQGSVLS